MEILIYGLIVILLIANLYFVTRKETEEDKKDDEYLIKGIVSEIIENEESQIYKLLNKSDRIDFLEYINKKTEFYPLSIFVIKKKFFEKLCYETFTWLKKCEKIFNAKKLKGYGEVRIFDFLAERYFSFWITKYCKHKVWPYQHIEDEK